MKLGWEFSNGLLVPITNDNIPAPMTLTEFFFFETVRRNDLVKDVNVFKTILSTLVLVNAFNTRMTGMIEKNILFTPNQTMKSKKLLI